MEDNITDLLKKEAKERFLRYVEVNTRSDPDSQLQPSTEGQLLLARLLKEELNDLGLEDVTLDPHGYVYACLPAFGGHEGPAITFCAHMDTSPSESGENVRPVIISDYDGGPIQLTGAGKQVLSPSDCPELLEFVGENLIVTDGRTLLGADDKAGIAEIMTALCAFKSFPSLPHPELRIVFTPDEEIGMGTEHIELKRLGEYGYTMDGGMIGELEQECFDAWELKVIFHGCNVHPGYAKNRMANAAAIGARFISALPEYETPEHTFDREGFFHLTHIVGDENLAELKIIIRDFDASANHERMNYVKQLARTFEMQYSGLSISVKAKNQYKNMQEVLSRYPEVVEKARSAMESAGIIVRENPIRGGTDGARLSFMGVPTPNIFTGAMMVHSKMEWIPEKALSKAAEVIVRLCGLWSET